MLRYRFKNTDQCEQDTQNLDKYGSLLSCLRLLDTVCRYDEISMYFSYSASSLRKIGRTKYGGTIFL